MNKKKIMKMGKYVSLRPKTNSDLSHHKSPYGVGQILTSLSDCYNKQYLNDY